MMTKSKPRFRFVVERTPSGWIVVGGDRPFGPFYARENAIDLARGMAEAIRAAGDTVVVEVRD